VPAERQKKVVYTYDLRGNMDCCELSEVIRYLQQLYIDKGDGTVEISGDDVEISLATTVLETQEEADRREHRAQEYARACEQQERRRYEELHAKFGGK
jgi:hypothetical protein